MGNPKALVHLGGTRLTRAEADLDPSRLPFDLADHERGRTADELWEVAIGDLRATVAHGGPAAWDEIVRECDEYSLHEFLRWKGWSKGAIEYFTVVNFLEADMHNSLVEILREDLGGAYVDMQEIAGGMDALPNAFYERLREEIRFGANVFAIDQDPDGVTVHFKTEANRFQERGDYAVITVPFSVLRTIEMLTPFSGPKQRAIRQLNYHASTKILFQVRERFWEEEDGILGGGTVTAAPRFRRINYPTPEPETGRGVLLDSTPGVRKRSEWRRNGRGDAPGGGARRRRAPFTREFRDVYEGGDNAR